MSRTKRIDRIDQNLIHNGDFRISQRDITGGTGYITDRFRSDENGPTGTHIATDVVAADVPFGGGNSLRMTCDAIFNPAGAQFFGVLQGIEGNFFDVIGKEVSLSFYVKANHLATYSSNLIGTAPAGSSYKFTTAFTIATINTWQKVEITTTIPGTGTNWNQDQNLAMSVLFELMAGTEDTALVDQWNLTSSAQRGVIGQDNLLDSIGNTIQFSKVVLKRGKPVADDEMILAGRDFADEIQVCQRYFEKSNNIDDEVGGASLDGAYSYRCLTVTSSGAVKSRAEFKVIKRVTPTVVVYAAVSGTAGSMRNTTAGSDQSPILIFNEGTSGMTIINDFSAVNGEFYAWHYSADCDF